MSRKICVITGTRAEYGLLSRLIKEIKCDKQLTLQLVVTGMHLSPEFGLTYREIEADGFPIAEKVEMLLSSDSSQGIAKSIGTGVLGFSDVFERLKPDLLVVLGDRFEIAAACMAALPFRIPIAHIHGGEITQGLIDEAIRHAVSKMAHLHFVSTQSYRRRVIQMGEEPKRVFCVGAPGVENIKTMKLLPKDKLEEILSCNLGTLNFLVTFHPVTLEKHSAQSQFKTLLKALDQFPNAKIFFTKPNADTDGRIIGRMIDDYVAMKPKQRLAFISLGEIKYLSLMKHASVVVGNSSSGIIEAPSLKIPTVNIGDRQKGRVMGETVLSCQPQQNEIVRALKRALSPAFRKKVARAKNVYDGGVVSKKIKAIIKKIRLDETLLKKKFYDIPISASRLA